MKTQIKAYIYAISSILLWSTVASAFKISLRYMNFLNLLLYSSLFSSLILFFVVIKRKKYMYIKNMPKKEWKWSIILGFLNPFLYYTVLFKAYSLLPAQEAQSLNYTWPIVLVLLSAPVLKQKVTLKNILSLLIGFLGVIIIATHGKITTLSLSNPLGVILATGSSLIWALFWLYNVKDKRDADIKLFLNFVIGFLFTLILTLTISKIYIPKWQGLIGTVYVGAFEMSITFLLWLQALSLSETSAKIGNLVFLSPFISLIFIHFIVGETILPSTVFGLILIIGSIIL